MRRKKHNYLEKLKQMERRGQLPLGSLSGVDVYHDDWCAIHTGGYCNCDPDVELSAPGAQAGAAAPARGLEEVRPLEYPTRPCPHCGHKEFVLWTKPGEPAWRAISCDGCGAVLSCTHPLDPDDRPMRRP